MSHAATLLSSISRRPLLLEPTAAQSLLDRLVAQDPRGLRSEGRLEAALRKIFTGRGRPGAWDDDDEGSREPEKPTAYCPLWAQQAYGDPQAEGFAWSLFNGIACLEIATAIGDRGEFYCGVWYHGYDTILASLRECYADPRVKGIFVRMFTPGGVVAGGLPTLAKFIRTNRATGNDGGKPIHFYCDMACSAGSWITASGDRIVAPRVGMVGSNGAVIIHTDASGAYEKAGLVVTPIEFPVGKTDGASFKPLGAAARADLESEIRQCAADFFADVAAGRPQLTPEKLEALGARVFLAHNDDQERSGLALGLVDAVMGEEEAFQELLERVSATHPAPQAGPSPPIAADGSSGGHQPAPEETKMATKKALKEEVTGLEAALAALPAENAGRKALAARISAAKAEMDEAEDEADEEGSPGGDGEDETTKKKPSASSAEAILDLPEAKDRGALARKLAFQPGMTIESARGILAVAGKEKGGLIEAMNGHKSPELGAGGEPAELNAGKKPMSASERFAARAKACSGLR